MVAFIDDHRNEYGIEPICEMLPIVPSTYYAHKAQQIDPHLRSDRAKSDAELELHIRRVWDANFQVYGTAKGVASAEAGRSRCRSMHGGAFDAENGPSRGDPRPDVQDDDR